VNLEVRVESQATENAPVQETPRGNPRKTLMIVAGFVAALILLVALNMK
jgi:hypothetical protein